MSNPAYTRNLSEMAKKQLPQLLEMADLVREMVRTPAWAFVMAQIADNEQKSLARLLNETTRPEEIPRLRGLVAGLAAPREAAESIVSYAEEAERKANERLRAQEQIA